MSVLFLDSQINLMENSTYKKDFDLWNEKKKDVNSKLRPDNLYFHEREVWWCSVGVNVGVEIDGKNNNFERPVLIIKKFNRKMFWGVPLTTKFCNESYIINFKHDKGSSFANLAQLRMFSSKRILRKLTTLSDKNFGDILNRIKNFI